MKLFDWLRPPRPTLSPDLQQRCDQLAAPITFAEQTLSEQRWVVLDLETSGLDMQRDVVLSIGAVVIQHGAIDLSQQFEATLLRENHQASASTLIHGIAPSQIAAGQPAPEALLAFMEFTGDSPLLAYHARFDQHMLGRAMQDSLGYRLQHCFIDVAELAPLLCPEADLRHPGLDDWVRHFGLQVELRHHASADALVTAELALILFSHARRQDLTSLATLAQQLSRWRRHRQAMGL